MLKNKILKQEEIHSPTPFRAHIDPPAGIIYLLYFLDAKEQTIFQQQHEINILQQRLEDKH